MLRKLLLLSILTVIVKISLCDKNEDQRLILLRRAFLRYIDEDKLQSYLSSFGNPSAEESRKHMVYKRASSRVRKLKKNSTTTPASTNERVSTTEETIAVKHNGNKNITISPRHIVKFELEDAKYSEEYEKLKKSRKLRVKRSSDEVENTTKAVKIEEFITKDTFMQPKQFYRFLYSDAIFMPSDVSTNDKKNSDQKKNKREVLSDSTASDTKKIKVTHPLSTTHRTKHVSFDELPIKVQKTIESAMSDAILKGKANDGDYLKFYYGDKVIKVPITMSKYLTLKAKETQPSKTVVHDLYARKKTVKFLKEDVVAEPPQLLGTKNAYFQIKDTQIKYEAKPYFLPTTTTEKPSSYFTFNTPKENLIKYEELIPQLPPKKSIYFFTNAEPSIPKNSLTSPGPVIFESTTPSTTKVQFEKHIEHPIPFTKYTTAEKEVIRQSIPITEEVNESHSFIPEEIPIITEHKPLPPPRSYIEFSGANHADSYEENKNYEFGYHISDYKTGNNFGHVQSKKENSITGEYSILLPDGRVQVTKYWADDSGFHANVSYQNVH